MSFYVEKQRYKAANIKNISCTYQVTTRKNDYNEPYTIQSGIIKNSKLSLIIVKEQGMKNPEHKWFHGNGVRHVLE